VVTPGQSLKSHRFFFKTRGDHKNQQSSLGRYALTYVTPIGESRRGLDIMGGCPSIQQLPDSRFDDQKRANNHAALQSQETDLAEPITGSLARTSGLSQITRLLLKDPFSLLAGLILTLIVLGALGAGFLSPYSPNEQDLRARNQPPTFSSESGEFPHLLGTDQLGRDLLSRLLHGSRVSLTVGFASVLLSGSVGTLIGLLAGFYRGRWDSLLMRLVDIQMGFPNMLLALTVLYVLGPGFVNLVLVLGVTAWMIYARVTRAMTLSLAETLFIESARATGCTNRRILFAHLFPNLASPLLVLATLEFGSAVISEAALSFLGFGIRPPQSSWGLMLAQGREYMTTAWWLTVFPGLCIFVTVLSLNLFSTSLRTITDPTQRNR
jgi:peptide/nickel transport system permease protein